MKHSRDPCSTSEDFKLQHFYDYVSLSRTHFAQGYVPVDDELKDSLTNKMDEQIFLEKSNYICLVSTFWPQQQLFYQLRNIIPSVHSLHRYSNLQGEYITKNTFKWSIEDMEFAKSMFGEQALSTRNYPDSKGVYNPKEKKGGLLIPTVTKDNPMILKYEIYTKTLSVEIFFDKRKQFVDEKGLIYSTPV